MAKKRRLSDLYRVGRPVTFNDDSGLEPIEVYIKKLSATEAESVVRRAGAARSKVLLASRDREGEIWRDAYNEVCTIDREQLVNISLTDEINRIMQNIQAEVAAEDEWSEGDFFQGLKDAWWGEPGGDGGLKFIYEKGDESDEQWDDAKRTFEALRKFDRIVAERVEEERQAHIRDAASYDIEELREKVTEKQLELKGDQEWLRAFQIGQVYYGTRESEKNSKRYFESYTEIDQLDSVVLEQLFEHFKNLSVDATEGKDSPLNPDSSQQSAPADEGETAASSGPEALTA